MKRIAVPVHDYILYHVKVRMAEKRFLTCLECRKVEKMESSLRTVMQIQYASPIESDRNVRDRMRKTRPQTLPLEMRLAKFAFYARPENSLRSITRAVAMMIRDLFLTN